METKRLSFFPGPQLVGLLAKEGKMMIIKTLNAPMC